MFFYIHIAKSELEDFDCPIYTGEFEDIHRNDYELEQPQVITEEIELSREDVNIHNQNQEKIVSKLIFTLVTVQEERPHTALLEDGKLFLFFFKVTQFIKGTI